MRRITLFSPHADEPAISKIADRYVTLAFMQALVGGYIEALPPNGYCNEEGILWGLPRNKAASRHFSRLLVGPVFLNDKVS